LALLPLIKHKKISQTIHINAVTGSTGAGQQPTAETHFSNRSNNVSVYKVFQHQHENEIRKHLALTTAMKFVPVRGCFTRGIFASLYTETDLTENEVKTMYQDFYANEPFVFVSEKNPDLKKVVGTNRCLLYVEQHCSTTFIVSTIDNLLKGASGQAVQNFNLMFDLPENAGLLLKSIHF